MAMSWRRKNRARTKTRGGITRGTLAVATSAGIAAAVVLSGGVATAGPVASGGHQYYVDCGAGDDAAAGTTPATAWHTLAHVNTVIFQPGDSILLRRSTTCHGVLQPQGSGSPTNPIAVSAYGTGARPAIVADGARAAVFLHNVEYWTIQHLDVSDPGPRDGTSRTGIYVLLDNYGIGHDYIVSDVNVHDVPGCDCTHPNVENSGGVVFMAAGSSAPTGFDGIRVTGSTVSGVDGVGIGTNSQWSLRPQYTLGTNTFVPISHVYIGWNKVTDSGGDGILVQNGVDPLLEHNLVDGYSLRATLFHAGIWAFNTDHPVIQYNDIAHGAGPLPTWAFDIDAADSDVVYQYNYTHDNVGGMAFFCAVPGTFTDGATIRYNISQNDTGAQLGTLPIPDVTIGCGGPGDAEKNVSFYNNVVYSSSAAVLIGGDGGTAIAFSNNVLVGRSGGSQIIDPAGTYDHNLYRNVPVPSADGHAVTADPLFVAPGTAAGPLGYVLRCGSPAIGAGVPIGDNGGRDFFGSGVPPNAPPNIGAYQGPCVRE